MRAQARRVSREEEEESAFVSMTDMTVGFLFIIMILLVFFASQVNSEDKVELSVYEKVVAQRDRLEKRLKQSEARVKDLEGEVAERDEEILLLKARIAELEAELATLKLMDPLETYLARVAATRRLILVQLRDAMQTDFPTLQVEVSEESDALRFQGEGLFVSGSSSLMSGKQAIVARLAERLDQVLPCYTRGAKSAFGVDCNPNFAMIEAVQIEGHTDNLGGDVLNRNLSTERANNTFFAMTSAAPDLRDRLNLQGQPVLSVAAYGPDRPVAPNDSVEGRSTNRRIDLRFIMVTPRDNESIQKIREALADTGGGNP